MYIMEIISSHITSRFYKSNKNTYTYIFQLTNNPIRLIIHESLSIQEKRRNRNYARFFYTFLFLLRKNSLNIPQNYLFLCTCVYIYYCTFTVPTAAVAAAWSWCRAGTSSRSLASLSSIAGTWRMSPSYSRPDRRPVPSSGTRSRENVHRPPFSRRSNTP